MNDIEYLISKYYTENNTFSEETSSHWRKYGEKQSIKLVDANRTQKWISKKLWQVGGNPHNDLEIDGEGFGDFKKLNLINLIACSPIFIYCSTRLWPKLKINTFLKTLIYTFKSKQILGYDVTRMSLTIDFLEKNIGNLDSKRFCLIGDGYGRL